MRMDRDERRNQLTTAALAVVGQYGFAGLTLRAVAARAGVSHSLVRHHFGTRDQLLVAAFEAAAEEDEPASRDADQSPLADLRTLCEPPPREHYLAWIDAWAEAPRSGALLDILSSYHQACQDFAEQAIERAAAAEIIDPINARTAASWIVAALDGLAVQHYAIGTIDAQTHRRRRFEMVEHTLHLTDPLDT